MNTKSNKKLKTEEFHNLWKSLPEFLKQRRIKKAYNILKPEIKKQIFLLEKYKESKEKEKSSEHVYLFSTIKNFYDNVKLAFLMGKRRSMKNFTFYPARACAEMLIQLIYFCKQKKSERDEIAEKEILRIYARLHKREKAQGKKTQYYAKLYTEMVDMCGLNVSDINNVNEDKELNCFPSIYKLCHLSGIEDPKNYYFTYKCLCEDVHGKLVAIEARSQCKKYQNFTIAIMLLLSLCKEMLILIDKKILDSNQRKNIEQFTIRADEIVMGPLSFLEKIILKITNIKSSIFILRNTP